MSRACRADSTFGLRAIRVEAIESQVTVLLGMQLPSTNIDNAQPLHELSILLMHCLCTGGEEAQPSRAYAMQLTTVEPTCTYS